jgi:hypothetical protein
MRVRVCLRRTASGLLWISELIEENTRVAKLVGQRGIYVRCAPAPSARAADASSQTIIALHLVLCYADALPFWKIAFSIACHAVYLRNFSPAWPVIALSSPSFVLSCLLVVADHFLWFFHFAKLTQDARQRAHRVYGRPVPGPPAPGFADVATFFTVCIWLAPLFLFLSLSANDNALPVMTGASSAVSGRIPTRRAHVAQTARPRRSRP